MKQFNYVIKDKIGIHARPAGLLTKKAKEFESEVTIECSGKSTSATRLMSVMSMGIKCGDSVTVTVCGADEEKAASELEDFFKNNL
ncbi:MAG: HPr family phosphocarrier protein [Clostridia bacterium]|nr:HPr family phosphocarrier protein [Clostridia bacterium]